jgi:hypothetical protein
MSYCCMRYTVILEHGGWVVWDTITRKIMTHPATSQGDSGGPAASRTPAASTARWSLLLGSTLGSTRGTHPLGARRRWLVGPGLQQRGVVLHQGRAHAASLDHGTSLASDELSPGSKPTDQTLRPQTGPAARGFRPARYGARPSLERYACRMVKPAWFPIEPANISS